MIPFGMKISELIEKLQQMQFQHGDVMVFCGGEEYPGGVVDVSYVLNGNGYVASNSVKIHSGR